MISGCLNLRVLADHENSIGVRHLSVVTKYASSIERQRYSSSSLPYG